MGNGIQAFLDLCPEKDLSLNADLLFTSTCMHGRTDIVKVNRNIYSKNHLQ